MLTLRTVGAVALLGAGYTAAYMILGNTYPNHQKLVVEAAKIHGITLARDLLNTSMASLFL